MRLHQIAESLPGGWHGVNADGGQFLGQGLRGVGGAFGLGVEVLVVAARQGQQVLLSAHQVLQGQRGVQGGGFGVAQRLAQERQRVYRGLGLRQAQQVNHQLLGGAAKLIDQLIDTAANHVGHDAHAVGHVVGGGLVLVADVVVQCGLDLRVLVGRERGCNSGVQVGDGLEGFGEIGGLDVLGAVVVHTDVAIHPGHRHLVLEVAATGLVPVAGLFITAEAQNLADAARNFATKQLIDDHRATDPRHDRAK